MKKKVILSSVAALAGALAGTSAVANKNMMAPTKGMVHCKGISTKWVNDCGANGHGCAGQAAKNFDSQEWLKMSREDCSAVQKAVKNPAVMRYIERIQKGTIVAVKQGKKF